MKKLLFISFVLVAAGIGFSRFAVATTSEEFSQAMRNHLACFPLNLVKVNKQEISISREELCLAAIYAAMGMRPLWVSENGPNEKAALLFDVLKYSDSEGLRPEDYDVAGIQSLWLSRCPDCLADLDTRLTLNLIKYAHDVSYGRIIPFTADPGLFAEAGDPHFKPVDIVRQALSFPDFAHYLEQLPPSHKYYRKLRQALQYYRDIAETGGFEKVGAGPTLYPGGMDKRIIRVRHRLARTGALVGTNEDESLYDDSLVAAIKTFQSQFGLEPDGIIGRKTMAALNKSLEDIMRTISLNMARWRWQEHDLGTRYIMVNIANYELTAVENGHEKLRMAVIVGKFHHQTPVFSHRVQYVVFNPFWNIPSSIARNEELPRLRKDPYYLTNRHVRLFSNWQADAVELDSTLIDWQAVSRRAMNRYKLRQDPGPWNVLGPVKLVFPNRYHVYIHGTPAQDLFDHRLRNFSHGCIRASHPLALAGFALEREKQGWSVEKIEEVVSSGKRKVARLSDPLPVHITYQTVWVDKQGIIRFNNDNYGRDQKLAKILFAPSSQTVIKTNTLSELK